MKKTVVVSSLIIATTLTACATVRQQDLDAWVGMPVEALDLHSFFTTLPMSKTVTESGIEIRNYANGAVIDDCDEYGSVSGKGKKATYTGNTSCIQRRVGCNNIFYIKDKKVIEYAPTGQCFTDQRVQPQARYQQLKMQ